MILLNPSIVLTPVGYVDPVGVGKGWHYVVCQAPSIEDAWVLPNFDGIDPTGATPPTGFHKVARHRATLCDFGGITLTTRSPGSAWPLVYVAPFGTVFCGSHDQVIEKVGTSLRSAPDAWAQAPLLHLEMVQYAKADDLLAGALANAYAFMCSFPKDSGPMWAENTLGDAVRPAVTALMADADRTAVRDAYRVRVADGAMWFVTTPDLAARMAPDDRGILATAAAYAAAFGLAFQGLVEGGEHPWRWKPTAVEPTSGGAAG